MKKVSVLIPAKINLTLDVLGVKDGYHDVESLVDSINLYDRITVKKRDDKLIRLNETGIKAGCIVKNNNAYKAAVLFMQTFKTSGVDITLNKNIPVGAGLGGSSADIAGVLVAMKKLFGIKNDIKSLADSLGSDSGYMIKGGAAIISGRGDKVIFLKEKIKLRLIVIKEKFGVLTKDCYKTFDTLFEKSLPSTTKAVDALHSGNKTVFLAAIKNDLYSASRILNPKIEKNLNSLKLVGADAAVMTGSGSAVYGVFNSKKEMNRAYKLLFPEYGDKLIKAKTL